MSVNVEQLLFVSGARNSFKLSLLGSPCLSLNNKNSNARDCFLLAL
jgi:hypothetical protein